jgi:SSS family solute:Na+ symporter
MSGASVALAAMLLVVAAGSALGFYAGGRHKMDLEQWAVAGRGFGALLVWLLMAGEVYTTFAFLGASGWAYSRGAPVLYIPAYISLGYVVSFYILPQLWEVGRAYRLQTESDFFEQRYGSKQLAAFVSILGVVFIVPYVELQLSGLGFIVQAASFQAIGRTLAMVIAAVVVGGFVLANGIRAVAWSSVLKDVLLLAAALSIGLGVPSFYFHGIRPMFAALVRAHPNHLVMPGATQNLGHGWYVSTVLLNAVGFYMWPHVFGAAFTAKSGDVLRRNAVIMPLYTITLPFMLMAGFAAILIIPGLRNGDLSLLTLVRRTFPAWWLGVIGGAGALTAMVPAAILILTAATLFAKNFFRPLFAPQMTDDEIARLAKIMVVTLTGAALGCAIYSSISLVGLLLLGYDGVTQFFPGVVLGLYWKRVTRRAVWSGMLAGVIVVVLLILSHHDPLFGLNAGFVALALNFVIVGIVSLLTPAECSGFEEAPTTDVRVE